MYTKKSPLSPTRLIGMSLNAVAEIHGPSAGKLGFYLFSKPRKKSVKPEEAAFLATADFHYALINGRKYGVYHWGFKGPTILMAHGWESHSGRWRKMAPLLVQAGYQVVAVDAPAHGRSSGRNFTMLKYADLLRTMLQRIGPVDTIIGHSVGGAAAIWAMGTGGPSLRPQKAVIMASFSEMRGVIDNANRLIGASDKTAQALDRHIERTIGNPVEFYSVARMAAQLEGVKALLIHDRQDRITPIRESEQLLAAWPGATLIRTSGFGHGLTAPEAIQTAVNFVLDKSHTFVG